MNHRDIPGAKRKSIRIDLTLLFLGFDFRKYTISRKRRPGAA